MVLDVPGLQQRCFPFFGLLVGFLIVSVLHYAAVSQAEAASTSLKVYVFQHDWCEVFHFGAVLAMCNRAGNSVPCEVIRDVKQLMPLRGSTSGQGTTFGLPVVEFDGLRVSQSVAGTILAGEALGYASGVKSTAKAMQFMLDFRDLIDNLHMNNAGYDGTLTFKSPPISLDQCIATGRFDQFFRHFERSIAGPFFFPGDEPSYVDYYFESMLRWVGHRLAAQESARPWPGQLLLNYSKVQGVLAALEDAS